ncbi:epididymal secretory protein E1-like [Trichogramma pretiosum]|uniref:epididymal secretory protein E1-like n=1 Tax=Trichogramma pretiosum TaxID=7493 RepID=UPI0006C9527A|nr:epididymal secretory protein E1-like [Trichogramma pretiosum]
MDYIRGLIIFGCLLASATCYTPFNKCMKGDEFETSPLELRIDGCREVPCILHKGTTMTAEWDFPVKTYSRVLRSQIVASSFGITMQLPSPKKNVCDSLHNTNCPVKIGQNVTYQMKMPIRRFYPEVSATVEIRFLNEFNQTIVCFEVDGAIVAEQKGTTTKVPSSVITEKTTKLPDYNEIA